MADTILIDKKTGLMVWKVSNLWHNLLRDGLKKFSITVNEFIILETLLNFKILGQEASQIQLSKSSGVDVSVVSIVLKSLRKKSLIVKKIDNDSRKRIIELTTGSNNLLNKILPVTNNIENELFRKLRNEENNFCNSLRLILGRKIRIKADKA